MIKTDCVGAWSECQADCSNKVYTITVAATGIGTDCPADTGDTKPCVPGEGQCLPAINCEGEWQTCSSACETASQRVWREVWAQSGAGAACPEPTDCEYGEGSCEAPVDCVGAWSECQADCGHKRFTISVRASASGQGCVARDGDTSRCAPGQGACPPDVDCEGEWSSCTRNCETAAQRVWLPTVEKSGRGRDCPASTDCRDGDGLCVAPVDCEGHFSPCTAACESSSQRIWIETVPPSGSAGLPCPLPTDCVGGEGNCRAPFDCYGWWSVCSTECKRHYVVSMPAANGGKPCEQLDGIEEDCLTGEGLCGSPEGTVSAGPKRRHFLFLQCDEGGCVSTAFGLLLFCSALVACILLLVHRCAVDTGVVGYDRRGSRELIHDEMMQIQEAQQASRAQLQPRKRGDHFGSPSVSFSVLPDVDEDASASKRAADRRQRTTGSRRSPTGGRAAGRAGFASIGEEENPVGPLIQVPLDFRGVRTPSGQRSHHRSFNADSEIVTMPPV